MESYFSKLLRRSPARYLYHRIKAMRAGAPQSNEHALLAQLATNCPRTFVEFGFHPTEYNCIGLKEFSGLLVDGDPATVRLAHAILPKRIESWQCFITLENIRRIAEHFPKIGVLSIDVDGNDYWFLEAMLPYRPSVVVVEYNASFMLRPVTVPYEEAFDRHARHASGWYHGASITALARLCGRHGYKLVAVSSAGGNAFFVPLDTAIQALDPATAYRESLLRNQWSGTAAAEQWARISRLPFVQC